MVKNSFNSILIIVSKQIRTEVVIMNARREALLSLALLTIVSTSCATVPTKQDFQSGVQSAQKRVSSGFSSGLNRLKVKGPSTSSKQSNDVQAIVSQYPLNQVPHTLLKKPVAEGRLTSGHGYRFSPTGVPIPKKHKGVDYAAPAGTPIYAAGDGTIVKHYTSKSYGKYIRIEHANGFFTAYAHMQDFADGLSVGSGVSKGQVIGNIGSTGRSSGPHLHFELIHQGKFIDPLFASLPPQNAEIN